MENKVDFDLLNEKLHPRKRLRGRKGCFEAGCKGSQRREGRVMENYLTRYPQFVVKSSNPYFNSESEEEEEGEKNRDIDDGDIEETDSFDNRKFMYGRYVRKPSFFRVEYSLDKKKRWELKNQLKEKDGFYGRNYDSVSNEITEDTEEDEKKKMKEEYESTFERYIDLLPKNRKTKKKKKEKRIVKKPMYLLKIDAENYHRGYGTGYYYTYNRFQKSYDEYRRKKAVRRDRKSITRKKKELKNQMKKLERKIKRREKEERNINLKGKNINKGNKSRSKRRMRREERNMRRRIEKEAEKEVKRKEFNDVVVSNPHHFQFVHDEDHVGLKKWARKPKKLYKDDLRLGRRRKRRIRNHVKDTLSMKY